MTTVTIKCHLADLELYEHRCALFLALMKCHPLDAWFAVEPGSPELPEWFLAGIDLPSGAVSYHLPIRWWSHACSSGATLLASPPKWDGHTSDDVFKRLCDWILGRSICR